MVKIAPFFLFAVSATLLPTVRAGACDFDPSIPTTCNGRHGWYPISVVGRGVYCTKGPNVCVADNSHGACPGAQAGLEFGSKCDSLAPGIYGCFPKDSCDTSVGRQENAVVQSPPQTGCEVEDDGTTESAKVKTDPPTYTPTLPPVKEDGTLPSTPAPESDKGKTDPPTYTPTLPPVKEDGTLPSTPAPESDKGKTDPPTYTPTLPPVKEDGTSSTPYGSGKEDAPVKIPSTYGSPEDAPAGRPGDSSTSWMVDVPENRSHPDSSSPKAVEGSTPPSYNSPGGAPTDSTPTDKPEAVQADTPDTPAPTPCDSSSKDVPAITPTGKPEAVQADTPAITPTDKPEAVQADTPNTPAPTPCESSSKDVPAITPTDKPEAVQADTPNTPNTPVPTPCDSSSKDVPAITPTGKPEAVQADTPDTPAITPTDKPEAAQADTPNTPTPTPCDSSSKDVPAITPTGKPEAVQADTPDTPSITPTDKPEAVQADTPNTPAPTPCESTEQPAGIETPTQEQQQQDLFVVPPVEQDGIDYNLDLGDRRLRY